MTRRPALIVGAAIVVVAIAAIAVFATRRDEPHAAPGSASSSPPSELLDEIGELKGFVESKRGLPFKEEVSVKLLADDEFREHLKEDSREEIERKEAEEFEAILRALKLMQGDVNLSEKADELAAESVLGFYDPETKDLVVRGERPTPFLRQVLVHELTHALQDQHFNLQRPDLEQRDDETILTFDAVVEGDASRIEAAYFSELPPEQRRQAQLEEESAGGLPLKDVPDSLLRMFAFPYEFGPLFVDGLLQSGGQPRLDDAFRTPPATSEQVVHPERFLRGEGPISVARPPAEGEVFDEGVFGQLGVLIMLSEGMPKAAAFTAAEGWGGDYYVAWRTAAQGVCIRVDLQMDNRGDLQQLHEALASWTTFHTTARVQRGSTTRITACS